MPKVKLTGSVRNNKASYSKLVSLFNKTNGVWLDDIEIDCSGLSFLDGNMCALLGCLVDLLEEDLNDADFINLDFKIKSLLDRNGFSSHYGFGDKKGDHYGTTVAFKKFNSTDHQLFQNHIVSLLSYPDLPNLSERLKKLMKQKVHEIFQNAETHGGCSEIYTCGQAFPKENSLYFTIVNLGKTIKSNVSQYLNRNVSGHTALEWACIKGNTTRQSDVPGGLGLSLIKEFLSRNKGELFMISGDGYLKFDSESTTHASKMANSFAGTIVTIKFNLSDNSSYYLLDEVKDIEF